MEEMLAFKLSWRTLVSVAVLFNMSACTNHYLVDSNPAALKPKPRPESTLWYQTDVVAKHTNPQGVRTCDISETIEVRATGFRFAVINHHRHTLANLEKCSSENLSENHIYRELIVKYDDDEYWYETTIHQETSDRQYWRLNEWRNVGKNYRSLDPYELIDAINSHRYEFEVIKPMVLVSFWKKTRISKFSDLTESFLWYEHRGFQRVVIKNGELDKKCSPIGVEWSSC